MARFLYTRTKKLVDIPDHLADAYEKRRWYQRLPEPETQPDDDGVCWAEWGEDHECKREPGHDGRHSCVCGSWTAQ